MAIDYRVIDGGYIEQQDADGSYSVHKLEGAEKTLFDTKTARWFPLALDNEQRTGMPAPITTAIIYSESGGNENAQGPSSDHGLGLMMITAQSLKQGLSDADVMIPENNIRLGVDALATSAAKVGYDVPKLASMFNAGSDGHGPWPSSSAPWGYREYKIPSTGAYPYISKVVRAYNYGVDVLAQSGVGTGFSGSSTFKKIALGLGAFAVLLGAGTAGVVLGGRSR